MYNSNTKIARWPLNIADLQAITGSSNQDIGNAIVTGAPVAQGGNGSINQWARYKPIRDSRYTPLTEQDLANADYGFNLASGGDGAFARGGWANIVAMANRAFQNGAAWTYLAPRSNATDKYRITDFTCPANRSGANGYNGNAKAPFQPVSTYVQIVGGGDLPIGEICNVDSELPINLFHTLLQDDTEHDFDEYNLAVITKRGQTYKMFISDVRLIDMMNQDIGPEQYVHIILDNADGTTQCLFVGTTCSASDFPNGVLDPEADIDDDYTFWLPNSIETVVVSAIANAILLREGNGFFFRIHTTSDGEQMYDICPQVYITNSTNQAQTVTVTVDLEYYDNEHGLLGTDQIVYTGDFAVLAQRNVTMETIDLPPYISEEEGYGLANIGVRIKWQWNPTAYHTETRYFDFATGNPTGTNPGFTTLDVVAEDYTVQLIPIS